MLRLIEVASQSETFSKRGLRKAKTNTVNSITVWMTQPGHYRVVFALDRPPLLAVRLRSFGAGNNLSYFDKFHGTLKRRIMSAQKPRTSELNHNVGYYAAPFKHGAIRCLKI